MLGPASDGWYHCAFSPAQPSGPALGNPAPRPRQSHLSLHHRPPSSGSLIVLTRARHHTHSRAGTETVGPRGAEPGVPRGLSARAAQPAACLCNLLRRMGRNPNPRHRDSFQIDLALIFHPSILQIHTTGLPETGQLSKFRNRIEILIKYLMYFLVLKH